MTKLHALDLCPVTGQVSGREFTRAVKCHIGFVILSGAPRNPMTLLTDGRAVEGSRGYLDNQAASGSSLDGLSPEPHFASPVFGQVLPALIGFFDQRNLLLAPPALELLLASDCILNMVKRLVVNEPVNFVFFGEAFDGIHLVLCYAAINISCNADIERACPAGQDIYPEFVIETFAHGGRVSQAVIERTP